MMRERNRIELAVGIIGWLFAPLLIYIIGWKINSLIEGTSQYPSWFVLADALLMLGYVLAIFGFWRLRRWSVDLYVGATLIMLALHAVLGIFTVRHFALPLLVCVIGLLFRKRLIGKTASTGSENEPAR